MNIEGWQITTADNRYIHIERDGAPGTITIKADDDGFVVDIWSSDIEPVCAATTWATYNELEPE